MLPPPVNIKSLQTLRLQAFNKINIDFGGERGIRTPGPVTVNGFQDRRVRPLCQLSAAKIRFEIFQPKSFTKLFVADLCLLPPQGPLTQQ